MDGETLGKIIQKDTQLSNTRMVMLTSIGMPGDAKRLEDIGFLAYTTKPVRHQELKDVLSIALGVRDKSALKGIATRYTVRETLNLFIDSNARILLAEDNITNQQVALGILKKLELKADAVATGLEVLKALETLHYDLVLMDILMPEMDGIEATRHIRGLKSANAICRIPIIAMTAHAMQGDRESFINAGMNDYISKPVSPQALLEVLKRWLSEAESTVDIAPNDASTSTPVSNHLSHLPVFDKKSFMGRLLDDKGLAQMVIEGFLDDIPKQIAILKGYLETGKTGEAAKQAHTIKGASANVGGERLRNAASEIEKSAKKNDLETAAEQLIELHIQFDILNKAMKEYLENIL